MSKQIDFTKPLSKADQAYVKDRPWLEQDARLRGEFDEEPDETSTDDESYEAYTVKELQAEVKARNEERDEDSQIEPASQKKDDLISALEADDEANPADQA